MTLCLAWKINGRVRFASDSRVRFGATHVDLGVKVFDFPVVITGPASTDNIREKLFEARFGMCFAGSLVNAFLIKEAVAELLGHLQFVPGYTDVSVEALSGLAFQVYSRYSMDICNAMAGPQGIAEIILGGMCPRDRQLRLFKLSTSKTTNRHVRSELALSEGEYEVSGNGQTVARKQLERRASCRQLTDADFLEVLQTVIDDPAVEDVGGPIQFGTFVHGDFRTSGSMYYATENGRSVIKYMRVGLDLNSKEFQNGYTNFIFNQNYIVVPGHGPDEGE